MHSPDCRCTTTTWCYACERPPFTLDELYAHYRAFADKNGRKPFTKTEFKVLAPKVPKAPIWLR